jgi:hypothetical protein
MAKSIMTLSEIVNSGLKVAFLAENRKVNKTNLKSKADSLKATGGNLVPLMYITAEKAINDGRIVVDAQTGKQVTMEEAKDYIVILDGQHRYTAAIANGLDLSSIYLFEAYLDLPTLTLVSVANIDTNKWKGGDFAHGAGMANPEDAGLKLIQKLTDQGINLNTVSLMTTFTTNVTSAKLAKIMAGEKVSFTVNEERCTKIYSVLKEKFSEKLDYLKHRYIWTAIVNLSTDAGWQPVYNALEQLTDNEVAIILGTKGDNTDLCAETIKHHLAA